MSVSIRPLQEADLPEADRVMRLAFGTFVGLPDPMTFAGDGSYVHTRFRVDPAAAFAAERDGELVGSNFVTSWGSFGFFGPLSVRPDLWDQGIAARLLEPVMALFEQRGTRHAALFTFPHSPKHHGLYQKFGFYPRFLTPLLAKPAAPGATVEGWSAFSDVPAEQRADVLQACRELTSQIFEGLDLTMEIEAVASQQLGDTVLVWAGSQLVGLAVCHMGAGTEAGSGTCYVKFGAARPGPSVRESFGRLLQACEALAAARGIARLLGGMNLAREEAYRQMLAAGFRVQFVGIAMQQDNEPGYNRPGVFVVDDWR